MKFICEYIDLTSAYASMILENISEDFPCYVDVGNPDSCGIAELTIECREEDVSAIRDMIADLV
jgi:hypothetical protein